MFHWNCKKFRKKLVKKLTRNGKNKKKSSIYFNFPKINLYFAFQSTLLNSEIMKMDSREKHLQDLSEIRSLMERSSRFISLSGLSGISAGVSALLGAAAVFWYFDWTPFMKGSYMARNWTNKLAISPATFLVTVAALVLLFAIIGGVYFTTRKARRKGQKIWNKLSQKLLLNLLIPLVAGGIFCIALILEGQVHMVAPAMLIFYGLGLVNGGKYTLSDIHYLGLCEIGLGLIALFFKGYSLEFWAIGFGILHIVYGVVMYQKYESTKN